MVPKLYFVSSHVPKFDVYFEGQQYDENYQITQFKLKYFTNCRTNINIDVLR